MGANWVGSPWIQDSWSHFSFFELKLFLKSFFANKLWWKAKASWWFFISIAFLLKCPLRSPNCFSLCFFAMLLDLAIMAFPLSNGGHCLWPSTFTHDLIMRQHWVYRESSQSQRPGWGDLNWILSLIALQKSSSASYWDSLGLRLLRNSNPFKGPFFISLVGWVTLPSPSKAI